MEIASVIKLIVSEYDSGVSPSILAVKYGRHPTTIRKYLRRSGRVLSKVSPTQSLDPEVRNTLKRLIAKYSDDVEGLLKELEATFLLEPKSINDDFKILNV